MRFTIAILLILLFASCGSRKAEVEKLKMEIRQQRELVLNLQNDIQSNIRIIKVANKHTIEPINQSEISTFNGTSFQNARITIEKTKSDSIANVNDQSTKEIKLKENNESKLTEKTKETESKKPNPYLWLGVVIVCIFLIWMFLNKRRTI